MSVHIIIDGYNLIRQSHTLSSMDRRNLQKGRDCLIDKLAAYKKIKAHRITVVFDGIDAPPGSHHRDRSKGISIRFSRNGESADAVIKRMASKDRERALVVSSDREIVNFAAAVGSATIDSPYFEKKINMAEFMEDGEDQTENEKVWTLTTKKKGPSRRLSKRKRRDREKIKKL